MCGIAILVESGESSILPDLSRISEDLRHRGPDDEGIEEHRLGEATVGMAHRRLSILDLSSAGHQPFHSDNERYSLSYNGEIYNYRELRTELAAKGHRFRSETDTEVLLAAYREWGVDCVRRFVGMFAFAIVDRERGNVFGARDFFGIKPLYYTRYAGGFAFASEIKALRTLPIGFTINAQRLYHYLIEGIGDFGDETLTEEIRQVPPGNYFEIDLRNPNVDLAITRYWSPSDDIDPEAASLSFPQARSRLRELFLESVDLHLRSDVPVGACLSGGIDSSAIVCAMRHLVGDKLDLNTFSFIAEDAALSEEKWVDIVVEHTRARAHKIRPNADDLLRDLDRLTVALDEPFGSTSIYAQHRVFRAAAEAGIKVMLDGQGADELLAGYTPYVPLAVSLARDGRPLDALRLLRNSGRRPGQSFSGLLKRAVGASLSPEAKHFLRRRIGHVDAPGWLRETWFRERGLRIPDRSNPSGKRVLMRSLQTMLTETSLPSLLRYEDRNSMFYSIESRVPFLSPRLTRFIYGLPEEYLISFDGTTKQVFREAMRGIVPDVILDRKDKIGFAPPELAWLSRISPWIERHFRSETAKNLPFLDAEMLLAEWYAIRDGRSPFTTRIWRCVNLIRWLELNQRANDK